MEENLEAACARCNYGGGSQIAAANRRTAGERIAELEQQKERLEHIVHWQEQRIEELFLELEQHRLTTRPARKRARPAIL
jgi:hypothetical protein